MSLVSLLALSIALAMDAFAVSLSAGIAINPLTRRHVFRLSFHFGLFQALMPVIGWGAGSTALRYVGKYDHWIAFALLAFIGGKMICEALPGNKESCLSQDPTRGWKLVFLSVATSIDALAAGMTLAIMRLPILIPALIIGLVAAIFTALGMTLGCRVGNLWRKRAELFGGVLLIAIGVKIVVDHLR